MGGAREHGSEGGRAERGGDCGSQGPDINYEGHSDSLKMVLT